MFDLEQALTDVSFNARTEFDNISFYFTCTSENSFAIALETILDASIAQPISAEAALNESFTYRCAPTTPSGYAIGGVVYNEMNGEFYSAGRRLDLATRASVLGTGVHTFDAGGDPNRIRHVDITDLNNFRAQQIGAGRCIVTTAGDISTQAIQQSLLIPRERPEYSSPSSRVMRQSHRASVAYAPEHDSAQKYLRFAIDIGDITRPRELFNSWLLEAVTEGFDPICQSIASRFGIAFLPGLSGVIVLGPRRVLTVTFMGSDVPPKLGETVMKLIQAMLLHTPPEQVYTYARREQLRFFETFHNANRYEPASVMFMARCLMQSSGTDVVDFINEVEEQSARLNQPEALREHVKSLIPGLALQTIVLAPGARTLRQIQLWEERLFERLRARGYSKSAENVAHEAPVASLADTESDFRMRGSRIIETRGIAYAHRVWNISALPPELLAYVPLFQAVLERNLQTSGLLAQSSLFCHVAGDASAVLISSIKSKGFASDGFSSEAFQRKVGHALSTGIESIEVIRQSTSLVLETLSSSPGLMVLSQASSHSGVSSSALRSWRGIEQITFLRQLSHDLESGERQRHRGAIASLAAHMLHAPVASISINGSCDPSSILAVAREIASGPTWAGCAPQSGLVSSHWRPNFAIATPKNECILCRRIALPPEDPSYIAAMLVASKLLNDHVAKVVLRQRLGAYAVSIGVDIGISEFYLLIYRVTDVSEALGVLKSREFCDLIAEHADTEFTAAKAYAINTLVNRENSLNRTLIACFNSLTRSEARMKAVNESLVKLTWKEVVQKACRVFADFPTGYSAQLPERSMINSIQNTFEKIIFETT